VTWQEALAFALHELTEAHFPGSDEDSSVDQHGVTIGRCCGCYQPWPCAVEQWAWDAAQVLLDEVRRSAVPEVEFGNGRSFTDWMLHDIARQRR
jgi:hypothetical protein